MMMKKILAIAAVLFSVIVWGVSFVSTKIILKDLPPISIAFFRQFVAIVPLLCLMLIKKEEFKIKRNEIPTFIIATLFGIVLYFLFENRGLTLTSASNASMLVAAIPVFALIAESIINRTPIDMVSFICIITSIFGVYLVIFEDGAPDFSSKTFLGNLLVMGAMFSWIIYTFLSKKLGARYSSLKMTTLQTFFSIPLFMPFIVDEISLWKVPSSMGILNLIFLGVFCSALAYVFFLHGIKTLGSVLPSALLNLVPVVTMTASTLVLSERISIYHITGAVLIVGSLTLLSYVRTRGKALAD